jgi:hypothetical protein
MDVCKVRFGQPPLPHRVYKTQICRGSWPAAPTNGFCRDGSKFVGPALYPTASTNHFSKIAILDKKKGFFLIWGSPTVQKSQVMAFFTRKLRASREIILNRV